MSDLAPTCNGILRADAKTSLPFEKASAGFAILDPPYLRVADGKRYENLGNEADEWIESLRAILTNLLPCLVSGGAVAIMCDDVLRKNEHTSVALLISQLIADFNLAHRATIYNHTPNFVFSMGPAQMKAARQAKLLVNGCKIIQVAKIRR